MTDDSPLKREPWIQAFTHEVYYWLRQFERGPLPRAEFELYQLWLDGEPGRRETADVLMPRLASTTTTQGPP